MHPKELDRENIRELDAEAKLSSKYYADEIRGAKESSINVGDVVLVSQQRNSKSDPTFSSERFTVLTRNEAKVVVVNKNGVQYARNVQDVKLAPLQRSWIPRIAEQARTTHHRKVVEW